MTDCDFNESNGNNERRLTRFFKGQSRRLTGLFEKRSDEYETSGLSAVVQSEDTVFFSNSNSAQVNRKIELRSKARRSNKEQLKHSFISESIRFICSILHLFDITFAPIPLFGVSRVMSVSVNHIKRRNLILEHAFALFAEEGFSGVTYQKIADRCGISRTLIYKYFKDKEEIFIYAVKRLTDDLSEVVDKIVRRSDLAAVAKLRRVLRLTVRLLSRQRVFLAVILDYLLIQKQAGSDVRRKVRRYTYGMKIVLKRLIIETINEGSFEVIDAEKTSALLFGLLESCVLNETVIGLTDWRESLALAENFIDERLLKKQDKTDE